MLNNNNLFPNLFSSFSKYYCIKIKNIYKNNI